jgi:hypothetical protein
MSQQLHLFARRGEVIPFPIERQRKLIRDTVGLLELREPGKQRSRYWRATLGQMMMTMSRWRVDQNLIDSEAAAFHAAVKAERNRQLIWGQPGDDTGQGGGGA